MISKKISFTTIAFAMVLLSSCAEYAADNTNTKSKKDIEGDSHNVKNVSKPTKNCLLTFDDGPDLKDLKILKTLKEHNAKATFFVNAQKLKQYPHVIKAIKADGHVIGNHSYSHQNLQKLSIPEQEQEILKGQQILKNYGVNVRHYRPAYGAMTPYAAKKLKEMNVKIVMWNLDTYDYRAASSDAIVQRVERAKNIKRPVILMHSIQPKTVKALPEIMDTLEEQGCRFVTV